MKHFLLSLLALMLAFNINAQKIDTIYSGCDTILIQVNCPGHHSFLGDDCDGQSFSSKNNCCYELYLPDSLCSLTPIEFVSFDVKNGNLRWVIENTDDLDYFVIENSINGYVWNMVNIVPSNNTIYYNSDLEAIAGGEFTYFRIKAVEPDGTFIYSKIIVEQNLNEYKFYFTPTSIEVIGNYETIKLYDIHGYELSLSIWGELPRGVYVLMIDGEMYTLGKP